MAKYIRIRHFGPIAESGELDIKAVMVFCGQQGSGKSTIAKLISTCSWIEKALARKEITHKDLTGKSFRERFCGSLIIKFHSWATSGCPTTTRAISASRHAWRTTSPVAGIN